MSDAQEKIIIGKINGVYGVKGWVKVFSDTEPKENITQYSPWYLKQANVNEGHWREVRVETGRPQGKTIVAKLEGFDDREESSLLNGAVIGVNRDQLDTLNENEYYWRDLIGCRVVNQQGIELGVVKKMIETGANDVLVVRDEQESEREYLLPWVLDQVVINVDLDQAVITVDWQVAWVEEPDK